MPRTTTITLTTVSYAIEPRAKATLQLYLRDIRDSLEDADTLDDIEFRMTELLAKRSIQKSDTIQMADAEALIKQLGTPREMTGNSPRNMRRRKTMRSLKKFGKVLGIIFIVLGILASAIGSYGWYANRHIHSETTTTTSHKTITDLHINVASSNVTVQAGTTNAVTITRHTKWASRKPSHSETWKGTTLTIAASNCNFLGVVLIPTTCNVDYTITVPASVKTTVHVDSGEVHLSNLSGAVVSTISSGDLTLSGLTGDISSHTDSGDLQATGLRSTSFSVYTSSGNINATFATVPTLVKTTVDFGDTTISVPNGTAYHVLGTSDTGNRSVTVDQAHTSKYVVNISSDSGNVNVNYSGQKPSN